METLQLIKEKGLCCITGKPLKDCKNLNWVRLQLVATWSFPVWGNLVTKLSNLAVAYVHDDCVNDPALKDKVINAIEVKDQEIIYHPVKDLQVPVVTSMQVISLEELRDSLPKRATVSVKQKGGRPYIEFKVSPSLSAEEFEMVKDWQRLIIGADNISEFYTEETGHHWLIYLAKKSFEFTYMTMEDIKELTGQNPENLTPPKQNPEA